MAYNYRTSPPGSDWDEHSESEQSDSPLPFMMSEPKPHRHASAPVRFGGDGSAGRKRGMSILEQLKEQEASGALPDKVPFGDPDNVIG